MLLTSNWLLAIYLLPVLGILPAIVLWKSLPSLLSLLARLKMKKVPEITIKKAVHNVHGR